MGLFKDLFSGMDRATAEEYGELTSTNDRSRADVRRISEIEEEHGAGALREARDRYGR